MRGDRLTTRSLVATIGLGLAPGCNAVYDLELTQLADGGTLDAAPELPFVDRDRDGIHDPDDPCIASVADRKIDWEGDAVANEIDGCPFDYESYDDDGDGIYNDCDPLPALGGDRVRCIMAFQNPSITRALWTPRSQGSATWYMLNLNGVTGVGTGVIVANESFEAPVTTSYDVTLNAGAPIAPASEGMLTFWIRTNPEPSPDDLGCAIRGTTVASELRLLGATGTAPVTIPRRLLGGWKLQVTIAPGVAGRANVRCTVIHDFVTRTMVAAEVVLPPGTVGFGVDSATGILHGLTVIERDDEPAL
jgi:hypothetical protein